MLPTYNSSYVSAPRRNNITESPNDRNSFSQPIKIPDFPCFWYFDHVPSISLRIFLREGCLPINNQEKGAIFCEYFQILILRQKDNLEIKNCLSEQEVNCLRYIIKDIRQLDLTLSESLPADTVAHFDLLCQFLSTYFEGNAISFNGLHTEQRWPYYVTTSHMKQCLTSINSLVANNPNIISITLKCCRFIDDMPALINAIGKNGAIAEFHLEECVIEKDSDILALISYLEKKSPLRTMGLRYHINAMNRPQVILNNETVTQLNFQEDCLSSLNESQLLEALRNNTHLTTFKFKWRDTTLGDQCNDHLLCNRYAMWLIPMSEATEGVPRELFQLIFYWLRELDRDAVE